MAFEESATEEGVLHYKAVLNLEEQYSIWPADKPNPPGWRDAGINGTKPEVLKFIDRVWTDMRPLSLRQQMDRKSITP